ncbi:MAG TPA: hypothetical protein VFI91_12050 [Longimicrobiaceae bacterium]|nr:hypothetical protein [Longimicrobiaceae bacterium]
MRTFKQGNGLRTISRLAMLGALALPLSGCDTDEILRVDDPEVATPGSLEDPAALPLLVNGVIGDFQIAYSGSGGDAYLSMVSLLSDEFIDSETFPTRIAIDSRNFQPNAQGNTSDGSFERLQRARRAAKDAAVSVAKVAGADDPRIALLKGLEGYTYVALVEAFCSPIPFSNVVEGERQTGAPISRDAALDTAIAKFDAALAVNPSSNLAMVGKGRALLNKGEYAAAAAAVASVPTEYVYLIEHSANSDRQYNPLYGLQSNGRYSMSDNEGINGLLYRASADPRLPWIHDGDGFDGATPLYIDLRYPTRDSDVPLGGGIEARLIEAEAALQAGDYPTWLSKLNELRADVGTLMAARFEGYDGFVPGPNNPTTTLAPLTDPGTQQARVDLMFKERAFWLYTTGHRLGDMRRLIRQYGRTEDEVFPTGEYHKSGLDYGNDVAFPIPFDEQNNTDYDFSTCDTEVA